MKKAQAVICCFLLGVAVMLLQVTPTSASENPSIQKKKGARPSRRVSQLNLKSLDPLKEAFERDAGKVRIVTILSPT